MRVLKATFKCSSEKLSQLPKDELPEFAFIGRSNVGKSSLVNMLTGNSSLAKVSSTPGKTRLINHFTINDSWFLVDLPGYGYARASKSSRSAFAKIITEYVTKAENMHLLFVLVDSRHEPQKIDMNFIEMLGEEGIPFAIIFTKSDKLSAAQLKRSIEGYKKRLLESWESLPPLFITSSESGVGREELLEYIERCINEDLEE
ncbi:MAG: ribosome biogenesis GTP-binding protein YihA/YsxC [Rikenellaceae bacterium]